jgi:hypothetical protein
LSFRSIPWLLDARRTKKVIGYLRLICAAISSWPHQVGRHDDCSSAFRDSGVEYSDRFVRLDLVESRPGFRFMVEDRKRIRKEPADPVEVQSFRMRRHARAKRHRHICSNSSPQRRNFAGRRHQ